MRRGDDAKSKHAGVDGWTKQELMEAVGEAAVIDGEGGSRRGGLSAKTFDAVRKTARVKGPSHGGLTWVFSAAEVIAMIRCAEGGKFSERGGPIAAAWRALLEAEGFAVEPRK